MCTCGVYQKQASNSNVRDNRYVRKGGREGGGGDRGERGRERGMCVVRCGLKQRVAIKREKRCDFVNQQMTTDLCFVRQYITQIK